MAGEEDLSAFLKDVLDGFEEGAHNFFMEEPHKHLDHICDLAERLLDENRELGDQLDQLTEDLAAKEQVVLDLTYREEDLIQQADSTRHEYDLLMSEQKGIYRLIRDLKRENLSLREELQKTSAALTPESVSLQNYLQALEEEGREKDETILNLQEERSKEQERVHEQLAVLTSQVDFLQDRLFKLTEHLVAKLRREEEERKRQEEEDNNGEKQHQQEQQEEQEEEQARLLSVIEELEARNKTQQDQIESLLLQQQLQQKHSQRAMGSLRQLPSSIPEMESDKASVHSASSYNSSQLSFQPNSHNPSLRNTNSSSNKGTKSKGSSSFTRMEEVEPMRRRGGDRQQQQQQGSKATSHNNPLFTGNELIHSPTNQQQQQQQHNSSYDSLPSPSKEMEDEGARREGSAKKKTKKTKKKKEEDEGTLSKMWRRLSSGLGNNTSREEEGEEEEEEDDDGGL